MVLGMSRPTRYLTVTEVAQRLRLAGLDLSDETVRQWAIKGQIPAIRLPSGHYRFRIEDVDAVLTKPAERVAS